MKLENNNQEIIKRITNSSLKSNKGRNTFVVVAIILTTFMLCSIFSIGASIIKNFKIMDIRVTGNAVNIYLNNPREDQIKTIKNLGISKFIGKEINVGEIKIESKEKNKSNIFLKYHDKKSWDKQIIPAISDIKGTYPNKGNEAMISERALELLGKEKYKIGDKIKVSYVNNEGINVEEEFILSGTYRSYGLELNTGYILVSHEFIKNNNLSVLENGQLSITLKNSKKDEASKILESKVKLHEDQLYNYCYDRGKSFKESSINFIVIILVIGVFIVFSGYLLIYNIMYIAVTKDIHFYGLMKTIGTSQSQIKKIVKNQGLKLSAIGIPIGLILGGVISFIMIPSIIGTFSSSNSINPMPSEISFNPLIFIGSSLFSLLTVIISFRKPAKIASSISPIEALRYSGSKKTNVVKNRKSTNGGKLYKMAWNNVFRDKKRAILVFISLSIGIITFLSINTFLDCMSGENYINRFIRNDFEIKNNKAIAEKIDYEFISEIKNLKGVKSVSNFKVSNLQEDSNDIPDLHAQYGVDNIDELDYVMSFQDKIEKSKLENVSPLIIGVDDLAIDRFNENNNIKIDVEDFKSGKIILIDDLYYSNKDKHLIKDKITLKGKYDNYINLKGVQFTNKHRLLPDIGLSAVYISSRQLDKLDKKAVNYKLQINIDKKYEKIINYKLKQISKSKNLSIISKYEKVKEFNEITKTLSITGGGMSTVLILIGLLNFINVMVTSIIIRSKEFAIVESIGMTKKQISKMLNLEGMYYAGITTLLVSSFGVAIIFKISEMAKKIYSYAEFVFPSNKFIFLIILIFIICTVTPNIVYKYFSKDSVTERLREMN
ncbi:ABC transporter permease [Paraclostridium sordellii]|uniref:ABC transporter permease n=1 Tax=Paraclostridium sordellii TaxID=1505 RepID=UPI0030D3BABB